MQIKLDYGKEGLNVEVPDENLVGPLSLSPTEPVADTGAAVRDVLHSPTGTAPLAELAKGKKTVCILICDITRPVPNEVILNELLPHLEESGIARNDITILIATGLHRPNEGDELVELVGEHIAQNYRVENHFGKRQEEHTYLGDSTRGVPAWIDTRYVEADLKITIGLIEPHLMAGYSGGRKLICPGIVALATVKEWHSPRFIEHPNANAGILKDNPVHEENTEIAKMAGCDFIINVTLDDERNVTKVVGGDMEEAFYEGVKFVEQHVKAEVVQECDVVITSSAGYPLDITFYQSIKGLTGVLPIVKEGGRIIIAAKIDEGIGSPEFEQLFEENENLVTFMDRITNTDYFVMDQWQLEEMAKVCRKAKVTYVTEGLTPEELRRLFVDSAPTVEQAIEAALQEHGPDARIAVVPKGPYVLPVLA